MLKDENNNNHGNGTRLSSYHPYSYITVTLHNLNAKLFILHYLKLGLSNCLLLYPGVIPLTRHPEVDFKRFMITYS